MDRFIIIGNAGGEATGIVSLSIADIIRVDVSEGQTRFFISRKLPIYSDESFDDIQDKLLKFPFLRVKANSIINLEHIDQIFFARETVLTLSDEHQLVVDEKVAALMKKHFNK